MSKYIKLEDADEAERIRTTEEWIRVACRLCGKIMLFPKEFYKESDLIGWECRGALSWKCKLAYERDVLAYKMNRESG